MSVRSPEQTCGRRGVSDRQRFGGPRLSTESPLLVPPDWQVTDPERQGHASGRPPAAAGELSRDDERSRCRWLWSFVEESAGPPFVSREAGKTQFAREDSASPRLSICPLPRPRSRWGPRALVALAQSRWAGWSNCKSEASSSGTTEGGRGDSEPGDGTER